MPRVAFGQEKTFSSYFIAFQPQFSQQLPDTCTLQSFEHETTFYKVLKRWNVEKITRSFQLQHPELHSIFTLTVSNQDTAEIKLLEEFSFVKYIEAIPDYHSFLTPNDLDSRQYNLDVIQAQNAWDIVSDASNVVVAVIDDAVDISHPDLQPNVWYNSKEIVNGVDDDGNGYIDDVSGYDVADKDNNPRPPASASSSNFSHGTHCAGIVSAATNNNTGIASIGYNAKIMAVKCKPDGSTGGSIPAAYLGVEYAIAAGADIMSLSWGGSSFSQTYQTLFDIAHNQGMVVVAAAGNSNSSSPMFPASYNHVISVAATDQNDVKANFSNYGSTVDVSAPGVNIWSTVPGSSGYDFKSGTSMACPLVAGLCALMVANVPNASPDSIESCLKNSADNHYNKNSNYTGMLGSGRVNARAALQCQSTKPIANFSHPIMACPNQQITFEDKSAGKAPLTYKWTFTGGSPSTSTSKNPVVTYGSSGTYTVRLEVTNSFGTAVETKTNCITIATPTAVIKGNIITPFGKTVAIPLTFTGTPPFNVTLYDGSSSFSITDIKASPYILNYGPVTKDEVLKIQSFTDANCAGTGAGECTITIDTDSCQNLISNGDFAVRDDANCLPVGFKTNMKLDCVPSTNGTGYVHITDKSQLWNGGYWSGVSDHTGNSSNFMLGDGNTSTTKVWYQDIVVKQGVEYHFSAWFINANVNGRYKGATSNFEFRVDGVKVGVTGKLGATTPWTQYSFTHTPKKSGTIEVAIVNIETASGGNDFAIDDISFTCISKPSICFVSDYQNYSICAGDSLQIALDTGSGYQWISAGGITNDTVSNPYLFPSTNTLYQVQFTDTANCIHTDSFYIEVKDKPSISIKAIKDSLCILDSLQIEVSGGDMYRWKTTSNITDTTISNPYVFPIVDTDYTVRVSLNNGCFKDTIVPIKTKVCCGSKIDFTVSDTMLCLGDSIRITNLSEPKGSATYSWSFGNNASPQTSTSSVPPIVKFLQDGLYSISLSLEDDCGKQTKTQKVHVSSVTAFAGNDTSLCAQDTLQLGEPPIVDLEYSWLPTTGLNSPVIANPKLIYQNPITYVVEVRDPVTGCKDTDTVELSDKESLDFHLPNDTTLCIGDTFKVDGSAYPYSFLWSDGSVEKFFSTSTDTLVWVETTSGGCTYKDTVLLTYITKPTIDLPLDTFYCLKDSILLNVSYPNSSYLWEPQQSVKSSIYIGEAGSYQLSVTNVCGTSSHTLEVESKDCGCKFYVPNAISLNEDGLNETFRPSISCPLHSYELRIYNRWGELIYKTNDYANPWNAIYQGELVPSGLYLYMIEYVGIEGPRRLIQQKSGMVMVVK